VRAEAPTPETGKSERKGELKMPLQVYFILGLVAGIAVLAVLMSKDIKKHDAKMATMKKKKGRGKYMQQYKKPGK
jgi:flagellar basal body-associated protein FliL